MSIFSRLANLSVLSLLLLLIAVPSHADRYVSLWVGAANPDESDLGSSSGQGIMFGYQHSNYFALEGGFKKLGSFDIDSGGRLELSGYEIAAVGILPLNEQLGFYARVGNYWWDANNNEGTLTGFADGDNGSEIIYGAGINITGSEMGVVKLEYSLYPIEDTDIGYVGVGFEIHF